MALFRLLRFIQEASTYTSPDEVALAQAGADAKRHASFHRVIVYVSGLFGILGAGLGVALIFLAAGTESASKDSGMFLLAPLMFGVIGLLFGAALACLFAPRSFLAGPVGQKWMKLVGTESILVARMVCFILALMIAGVPTALGLLILLKGP